MSKAKLTKITKMEEKNEAKLYQKLPTKIH